MVSRRILNHYMLLPVAFASVSLCMADIGTKTRIEQDNPMITYTGTWYLNNSPSNSGGTAALTNEEAATASLTFTGTGIAWIGVFDPGNGLAQVYIDGVLNTVDTYGSTTLYQQSLFSARGLAPGPHKLTIQVMHKRDPNGSGSWVWVDAFDIYNGNVMPPGPTVGVGRSEQSSPNVTYNGTWFLNTNQGMSGGSAVLATDPGDRATFAFNGTGVTWVAYRDQWSGIANVYIDGTLQGTVDTYASPAQLQNPVYVITGLPLGAHTIAIEVTGTQNPLSGGAWIWVDAFDVK